VQNFYRRTSLLNKEQCLAYRQAGVKESNLRDEAANWKQEKLHRRTKFAIKKSFLSLHINMFKYVILFCKPGA